MRVIACEFPFYAKLMSSYNGNNMCLMVELLFVDLCDDQKVSGFPTIKYFNYGENAVEYEGQRKAKAFIAYMTNPPKAAEKREEL